MLQYTNDYSKESLHMSNRVKECIKICEADKLELELKYDEVKMIYNKYWKCKDKINNLKYIEKDNIKECTKYQTILCKNNDCQICYERSFASHPRVISWSTQNKISPRYVTRGTHKSYKFDCDVCKHIFRLSPHQITGIYNNWCNYCSNTILCGSESCKLCFSKSFASSPYAKFWSSKNETEAKLVFLCSGKIYKFECDKCNHTFSSIPATITKQNCWCPYCAHVSLCENNDCDFCFKNSFASNEKSKYWSQINKILPRQIFMISNKSYYFDCNKCKHCFLKQISEITTNNGWCIYCARQKLCENLDCKMCFENSFASHKMVQYWRKDNNVNPRSVSICSSSKFKFDCPHCNNVYFAALFSIKSGTWCSCKSYKTEAKLYTHLQTTFPLLTIQKQVKFDWCKNIKHLPFDFLITEYNIIIELDGEQHFIQVRNWKPPEVTQKKDNHKNTTALQHNYSIIRIYQPDVWSDKNNWQQNLHNAITTIQNSPLPIIINIGTVYDNPP